MKKNIFFPITFSRLRKNEFRNLVNLIVEFLGQSDPSSLDLQFVYNLLIEAQANLQLMKVPGSTNQMTGELADRRDNRRNLIRSLVAQIKVFKRTNEVYTIPQLDIVAPFVDTYLAPIVNSDSQKQTDILSEMYRELDAKPTVMDAIVNLNLRVHFDELRQLQDGFNQTFIQRSNAKNEGSKVVTQDVRLEAEVVITKLLKEIDLMQMKHSELDYNPLINNLNDTFTLFMTRAKTRTTIKKQWLTRKSCGLSVYFSQSKEKKLNINNPSERCSECLYFSIK
jgi:hypothetical protein